MEGQEEASNENPGNEQIMSEMNNQDPYNELEIDVGVSPQKKPQTELKTQQEILEQDNIFEIEMQVESDVEGGIDIDNECIYGHLLFIQVPSYQQESSMCDQEMTKDLMQQIVSINIRLYR